MRKQSGFTIIEMIAATLIFAMFSVAMLMTITQHLKILKKSQMEKRGSILARSLIEEHLTCPVSLGSRSGKEGDLSWTSFVDSSSERHHGFGIYRAHLTIKFISSTRTYDGASLCKITHTKHEA